MDIKRKLSQIYNSLPIAHRQNFIHQLSILNVERIKLFAMLNAILFVLLIIGDLYRLEEPPGIGHYRLLYLHISSLVFLSVIALSAAIILKLKTVRITKAANVLVITCAVFVLVIGNLISLSYPYGVISAYVISCFAVSSILYLTPKQSTVLFSINHLVFITGQTLTQDNIHMLNAVYINGTIALLFVWFTSITIYNTRVKDFLNNKIIENISNQDGLTGVANRRQFDNTLLLECNRALRTKQPLALILLDIDFFKLYNDNYGHLAGDQVLKKVAAALAKTTKRSGDMVARYGGEEFAVILPNTDKNGALRVAERLRIAVLELKIDHKYSLVSEFLTISLGVSSMIPDNQFCPEDLISQADKAMYEAKACGRNMALASL